MLSSYSLSGESPGNGVFLGTSKASGLKFGSNQHIEKTETLGANEISQEGYTEPQGTPQLRKNERETMYKGGQNSGHRTEECLLDLTDFTVNS